MNDLEDALFTEYVHTETVIIWIFTISITKLFNIMEETTYCEIVTKLGPTYNNREWI